MPTQEEIGLELDELVAMGDVEMLLDDGEIYYRLTEQCHARLRERERAMQECN